jgi:hypothetical protein
MISRPIECKGEEFEFSRASFRMWVPSPRVFVGQVVGHVPAELLRPLLPGMDRVMGASGGAQLFFEARGVTGYEPRIRTEVVRYVKMHRPQVAHFRILVGSRLLAMGIEVANLALSGLIEPYSNPMDFARDLDAATAGTALSSRVLGLLRQNAGS